MMLESQKKNNKTSQLAVVPIAILAFIGIFFINKNSRLPTLSLTPQDTTIHLNEKLVKAMAIGQTRMISSFLWSETLLRSDIKHYEENNLGNWMFLRLSLITTLDPYFYTAYLYGGVYLSIVKDDLLGASTIYEKGLSVFPEDYDLNFNAAFHYYYEVGDFSRAIRALETASKNPKAPPYFLRILSRLKAEEGNLEDAYIIIKNLYDTSPEGSPIRNKHEINLFFIRTEIDLKCLNSGMENCSQTNPHGLKYLKTDNGWVSPEDWTPYRVRNKKSK